MSRTRQWNCLDPLLGHLMNFQIYLVLVWIGTTWMWLRSTSQGCNVNGLNAFMRWHCSQSKTWENSTCVTWWSFIQTSLTWFGTTHCGGTIGSSMNIVFFRTLSLKVSIWIVLEVSTSSGSFIKIMDFPFLLINLQWQWTWNQCSCQCKIVAGPPQVRGGVLQHFNSFMSRMYSQTWMSATFTSAAQPTVSKRTALALRLLNRFKSMISAKNESGLLVQNPHFIPCESKVWSILWHF